MNIDASSIDWEPVGFVFLYPALRVSGRLYGASSLCLAAHYERCGGGERPVKRAQETWCTTHSSTPMLQLIMSHNTYTSGSSSSTSVHRKQTIQTHSSTAITKQCLTETVGHSLNTPSDSAVCVCVLWLLLQPQVVVCQSSNCSWVMPLTPAECQNCNQMKQRLSLMQNSQVQ